MSNSKVWSESGLVEHLNKRTIILWRHDRQRKRTLSFQSSKLQEGKPMADTRSVIEFVTEVPQG